MQFSMVKPLRIEVAGALHDVTTRGDRQVFFGDKLRIPPLNQLLSRMIALGRHLPVAKQIRMSALSMSQTFAGGW